MISKVIERYDSQDGSFAEIIRHPDGSMTVSVYGSSFEPRVERTTLSLEFARDTIEKHLPEPYTKTI